MRPVCGRRAAVCFCYLSHGLVQVHVCKIEFSHLSKNDFLINQHFPGPKEDV